MNSYLLLILGFTSCFVHGRPNLILYLCDDLGAGEVNQQSPEYSFFSHRLNAIEQIDHPSRLLNTPALEELAKSGKRFLNAYSPSSVCGPSRHAIMTGKHVGLSQMRGNIKGTDASLSGRVETIGKLMDKEGYETMYLGKWGVGNVGQPGAPWEQGYHRFYGFLDHLSAHNYFPAYVHQYDRSVWQKKAPTEKKLRLKLKNNSKASESKCKPKIGAVSKCTEITYEFRKVAESYIREMVQLQQSNFFLFWSTIAPHSGRYGTSNRHRTTSPVYGFFGDNDEGWDSGIFGHAEQVTSSIDGDIGMLLSVLKEVEVFDNTIIIFTSDNGPHGFLTESPDYNVDFFKSAGDYRGKKRDLFDGGIHIPLIVSWPNQIAKGSESNAVVALYDLPLTICDLIGAKDEHRTPFEIPGSVSFSEGALGNNPLWLPERDMLYFEYCSLVTNGANGVPFGCGVAIIDVSHRTPDGTPYPIYKYVKNDSQTSPHVFELNEDPSESQEDGDFGDMIPYFEQALQNFRTPFCFIEEDNEYCDSIGCPAQGCPSQLTKLDCLEYSKCKWKKKKCKPTSKLNCVVK